MLRKAPENVVNDIAAMKQRDEATILRVPMEVCATVKQFLLDGKTGNVTLHVKDGKILGFKIEQIVTVRT